MAHGMKIRDTEMKIRKKYLNSSAARLVVAADV